MASHRGSVVRRSAALLLLVTLVPITVVAISSPASADAPIGNVCNVTATPTTITLNADCVTTEALTIPDGVTLNGAGHTITANDPTPSTGDTYTGAVVTNAAGATSMNIENLTVTGPDGGFPYLLPRTVATRRFQGCSASTSTMRAAR